jgi:hypothetical protein
VFPTPVVIRFFYCSFSGIGFPYCSSIYGGHCTKKTQLSSTFYVCSQLQWIIAVILLLPFYLAQANMSKSCAFDFQTTQQQVPGSTSTMSITSTFDAHDTLTEIWSNDDACKLISCHFIYLVRHLSIHLLTLVSIFQNS